jgi:hypothetical protein
MRRAVAWTTRTGVALTVALAGAAGVRAQTPAVSILDARVVEGSGGSWDVSVTVTLSPSTPSPVDVPWSTADGSAISGQDYAYRTGLVTFPPSSTTQTLMVSIAGDTVVEWSPTLQMDEAFFIELGPPTTMNATLLKSRATVTILDDDRTLPGLQLVSAVADGAVTSGRVRLQWRVPPAPANPGPVSDVLVRWNEGAGCTAPVDPFVSVTGSEFFLFANLAIPVSAPGETQIVEHGGRPLGVRHCYALFAIYPPSSATMERATVIATPFDAAAPNPVAWAYSTDYPDVVPPTVGLDAVYTVSTDGVVHAMTRGEMGGVWPTGWNPVALGNAAHNRSPVVPLPYGQRFFVGTQSGEVHAVDGENGSIAWSRSAAFKNTQLSPYTVGAVQGTPAGLFTSWGQNDVSWSARTRRPPTRSTCSSPRRAGT